MAGNIPNELISKIGRKKLSKGVKVEVLDGSVSVDLALQLEYGYNILDISQKVQKKVQDAIENMTGLHVEDVNIQISGVNMQMEQTN